MVFLSKSLQQRPAKPFQVSCEDSCLANSHRKVSLNGHNKIDMEITSKVPEQKINESAIKKKKTICSMFFSLL